jgi:hypothetical protein
MIKVKISNKKVLEIGKNNPDQIRNGAGEKDCAGDQRYDKAGMEEYELDENLFEKKDYCYRKAKKKFDVFPSAYAGAYMAKCRKKKGKKKNEGNCR